jgi:hypothetical protein
MFRLQHIDFSAEAALHLVETAASVPLSQLLSRLAVWQAQREQNVLYNCKRGAYVVVVLQHT